MVHTQKMLVTLMEDFKKHFKQFKQVFNIPQKQQKSATKKHSSRAKYNTKQTNIRSCKIPLRITEEVVLVAHTQLKRVGEPESFRANTLNSVRLVQALTLWTSISAVSPSSVSDPSKALSRTNFSSYTQATAQSVHVCVCVWGGWPESTEIGRALPTVPKATQSLPTLQHRHMRGSLSIRGITVEWGALHNIVRAPCA